MARLGRPPIPHPRRHGAFLRFSDTEWGALQEALAREHPVANRRPNVAEWIRDLIVAHGDPRGRRHPLGPSRCQGRGAELEALEAHPRRPSGRPQTAATKEVVYAWVESSNPSTKPGQLQRLHDLPRWRDPLLPE